MNQIFDIKLHPRVKVKLLHPNAKMPTYAKPGDAGADLYATESFSIPPGERLLVYLGIALEFPEGFEGQMRPRSNMIKRGIFSSVCTIDQGYRGDVGVILWNTTDETQDCRAGDRIAQLIISPVARANFQESDELSPSERGAGGFGSTGR